MAQRLIVEGNDGIFIGTLGMKKRMPPPKGYGNEKKFREEFVKVAGSKEQIKVVLKEELNSPEITNIGIVVDSDNDAPLDILKQYIHIIESTLDIKIEEELELTSEGFVFSIPFNVGKLQIGIWIMPDNSGNGYLEHFMGEMIPNGNSIWLHAQEKITELMDKPFNEISLVRKQKALLHTYLAWREEPGSPIGLGIKKGYFDKNSEAANNLMNWFSNTFVLETP